MKLIIVALALVAVAAAAPAEVVGPVHEIKILRSEYDQSPEGTYSFGFETENGITRNEKGEAKEVLDEEKKPHVVVVVRGTFSYPKEDGQPETVNYYADETGYHAEGPSIPKVAGSS